MTNRAPSRVRPATWKQFWPLLRRFRLSLTWAAVAMALDALFTALRPWPLKVVIDRVLSHKPSHLPFLSGWLDHTTLSKGTILYGACAATLLIAISTGFFTYCFTKTLGDVAQRFTFDLRCGLFAHMQRLSLHFHNRQRTGDLTMRLTSDIQSIQDLLANGILVFGSNAFLLVGMLAFMFWLNWQFALAALSVAPFLFWTVYRYTQRVKQAAREANMSAGVLASVAQETLSSIRIVQGLAQEDRQDERFALSSASNQKAQLQSTRYQARIAPLVDLLSAMGLAIVMWEGADQVMLGRLTTGDVIVFFAYVTNLYSPMRQLARLSYLYNKAVVGADRIVEVMQTQSEVVDRPRGNPVLPRDGTIAFENVSFAYRPGESVLRNINLHIERGQRVALVGPTGAGKSTLASLVPRFYDPSEGRVCIDGRDIREYRLQSLRDGISLVLQDSLLFTGTIYDNIAFGRPRATEREIVAAATAALAHQFIAPLPEGYQTIIAEGGANLSGGQKQRIAIARAILRETPILILDEPTSGLDSASERIVVEALHCATIGRTTLIIAHRLASLRFADRIVCLEGGVIVEDGSPEELLRRGGSFSRYHLLQASSETAEVR